MTHASRSGLGTVPGECVLETYDFDSRIAQRLKEAARIATADVNKTPREASLDDLAEGWADLAGPRSQRKWDLVPRLPSGASRKSRFARS